MEVSPANKKPVAPIFINVYMLSNSLIVGNVPFFILSKICVAIIISLLFLSYYTIINLGV